MLNQTCTRKLRKSSVITVALSLAILCTALTPITIRALDQTTRLRVRVKVGNIVDVDIEKETETKTTANIVARTEPEKPWGVIFEGYGTAKINRGQLFLTFTDLTVKTSETIKIDEEAVLNQETSRALGYAQVTVLPGRYQLEQERVLRMNVRAERKLAEKASDKKFEAGVQLSSLSVKQDSTTEQGFGSRLTYNLFDHLAVEGELNHFPREGRVFNRQGSGSMTQGLFGVKATERFQRFGVFGKVGSGVVSFGRTITDSRLQNGRLVVDYGRVNRLAFDVGGGIEFYPTSSLTVRLGARDILIRYPCPYSPFPTSDVSGPLTNDPCTLGPLGTVGGQKQSSTVQNMQIDSSIGFRF